jgi:hypothetical protein
MAKQRRTRGWSVNNAVFRCTKGNHPIIPGMWWRSSPKHYVTECAGCAEARGAWTPDPLPHAEVIRIQQGWQEFEKSCREHRPGQPGINVIEYETTYERLAAAKADKKE